jgi:hypothetical protein
MQIVTKACAQTKKRNNILLSSFLLLLLQAPMDALQLKLYGWEHSVASSDYPVVYSDWVEQGYRLVYVTGFQDDVVRYNTIWYKQQDDKMPAASRFASSWTSAVGLTETELESAIEEQQQKQLVPVFVDAFSVSTVVGLTPHFNVIFQQVSNPGDWNVAFGQDSAEYQNYFDQQVLAGYDLQIISTYQENQSVRIASIFAKQPVEVDWVGIHDLNLQGVESATENIIYNERYSLEYISAGAVQDDESRFAGLFVKKNESITSASSDAPLPFVARVNVDDMMPYVGEWTLSGYMPKVTDAYQTANGDIRWALLFDYVKEELADPEPNGKTFPETACFDDHVVEFMKRQRITGANLAILRDGKIVYSQGYGVRNVPGLKASVQGSQKIMPYTPLRIASVSKPVTSLAVLRLVQDGRLGLSNKIFGLGGILQSLSDNPKPCCPIIDE